MLFGVVAVLAIGSVTEFVRRTRIVCKQATICVPPAIGKRRTSETRDAKDLAANCRKARWVKASCRARTVRGTDCLNAKQAIIERSAATASIVSWKDTILGRLSP